MARSRMYDFPLVLTIPCSFYLQLYLSQLVFFVQWHNLNLYSFLFFSDFSWLYFLFLFLIQFYFFRNILFLRNLYLDAFIHRVLSNLTSGSSCIKKYFIQDYLPCLLLALVSYCSWHENPQNSEYALAIQKNTWISPDCSITPLGTKTSEKQTPELKSREKNFFKIFIY